MVFAWIAGVLVVGFIILLSSKVECRISASRENKNDEILIDVHALYGLVKKRLAIPIMNFISLSEGLGVKSQFIDKSENQLLLELNRNIDKRTIQQLFDNLRQLLTHCVRFDRWLSDTLGHVHCTRMYWKTELGVGDAAETAMTTGMVWGLKSSLLGVAFRFIKLHARPELLVQPHFNGTKFTTEVTCTTHIRLFYVCVAGLHLVYRIFKVKNGLRTWQRVLFKV
ncbi:DUF2953 domain-containing protein [Paenibacillus xerothermodurans]|nr:DUF2953 domain-containing protein [Paenibacillus xerothermodurans]